MSATTKKTSRTPDAPVQVPSTTQRAADMEAEGQGQSMSVPDDATLEHEPRGTAKRAVAPIENQDASAQADQDVDTAGTEMDDQR